MITEELLNKAINHEIECMKYYAFIKDRRELTVDDELYEKLRVIGYTKSSTGHLTLAQRCAYMIINVNDMTVCTGARNKELNHLTALEYYWNTNKDERSDIIRRLLDYGN